MAMAMTDKATLRFVAARVLLFAFEDLNRKDGYSSEEEFLEFINGEQCKLLCHVAEIDYNVYRCGLLIVAEDKGWTRKQSVQYNSNLVMIYARLRIEGIQAIKFHIGKKERIGLDDGKSIGAIMIPISKKVTYPDVANMQAAYMAYYRDGDELPLVLMPLDEFIWLQKRRVNA